MTIYLMANTKIISEFERLIAFIREEADKFQQQKELIVKLVKKY